ncbi:MAG: 5-formyltetrahydrofolate cyclo-ligase [Parvibaculum sp.]
MSDPTAQNGSLSALLPSKSVLRQKALLIRADAHKAQGETAALAVLDHFLADVPFKADGPALVVAGYYPMRSEMDPLPLMRKLHERGCVCALPRVVGAEEPLSFHVWGPDSPTDEGPFSTRVPQKGADLVVPDILLVPLLAFDLQGVRLGFGGGFYDRSLDALRQTKTVLAVGIAYAAQEQDRLPFDAFDQPLDWVVTEMGSRKFERTA